MLAKPMSQKLRMQVVPVVANALDAHILSVILTDVLNMTM
ncbi:hypothetical protein Q31a_60490 [Aureliella helgolandensis]|uniref:Uncharacterized protein n=1 Tax=Aureliella helgolandensis TaxID=2527968 RepID=A0A518GGD8_9BACT|nr:hypothetical protein Q31a_60490 [Aureliella helgolandensis]